MRLLEINYLRAYAIISIVVWHCFVCPLDVWGIIPPTAETWIMSFVARYFIPHANMPLFTFISGYLFAFLYNSSSKYCKFRPFLKTKFERLVIPFLIIGTLVNITMPQRELYMILNGEGSHLWFCMMLFWCFMIRWTILKINNDIVSFLMLLISISANIYSKGSNWNLPHFPFSLFGIRHAVFFYFYFVLGNWIFNYRDKLFGFMKGKKAYMCMFLFSLLYMAWGYCVLLGGECAFVFFSSISVLFILLIYLLVIKLILCGCLKPNRYIDTLCTYSFGIYVFHEWISWGLYHHPFFLGLFEKYTFVYAFIFTIFDFVISIVLTHYLLKTKVGRYLLL